MKKLLRLIAIFWTLASVTSRAWAQDSCVYSPAFVQLRSTLGGLSVLAATKALQAFAATPQIAEWCEATALDNALGEREKQLVTLVNHQGSESPAHAVSRCQVFNATTAQCQSPFEDGTAHPNLGGALVPLKVDRKGKFAIRSQLPDAQLDAVYLTTLAHALHGKPATRLTTHSDIPGVLLAPNTVLMAIYASQGKNKAWAYRKAVWYF